MKINLRIGLEEVSTSTHCLLDSRQIFIAICLEAIQNCARCLAIPIWKNSRIKLVSALVLLVGNVRNPDLLVPILQDLGAKLKGYGAIETPYPAVGAALLQTFEQYLQKDWTNEVQQAWADPFEAVTQIMLQGADSKVYPKTEFGLHSISI